MWVGWRFDIQRLVTLGESLTHSVPDSVSSFIKRGYFRIGSHFLILVPLKLLHGDLGVSKLSKESAPAFSGGRSKIPPSLPPTLLAIIGPF